MWACTLTPRLVELLVSRPWGTSSQLTMKRAPSNQPYTPPPALGSRSSQYTAMSGAFTLVDAGRSVFDPVIATFVVLMPPLAPT